MVHKLYNQILDIPIVMCSRFKMGKGGEVGGGGGGGGGGAMLIPPQLIPNRFDKSSVATYCHIIPASHCPIHHQGLEWLTSWCSDSYVYISLLFEILCARWPYSDRITSHCSHATEHLLLVTLDLYENECGYLPNFSAWLCGGKRNSCAFSYSFMLCWIRWCACWQMGFCSDLMYNLTTNKTWQKCRCSFCADENECKAPPPPPLLFLKTTLKMKQNLLKEGSPG